MKRYLKRIYNTVKEFDEFKARNPKSSLLRGNFAESVFDDAAKHADKMGISKAMGDEYVKKVEAKAKGKRKKR